jgi:signal peptidase I
MADSETPTCGPMTVALGQDRTVVRSGGGTSREVPLRWPRLVNRPFLFFKLSVLGILVALVVWTGLLPQQLGGAMSYVITDGTSMLPHIHAGDLVIVRREPSYHVGEVAAYHNQQLRAIVLHRIVAIRGTRFVFKGDNNDFLTTDEPTKTQIVGAEWLQLDGAGHLVLDLRTPAVAALLLGALWLFSFRGRSTSRRQRRRHRHA